jgi:hypothetical protein
VVGNIDGLPPHAWVSSVEAGHFDAGTVYATFDLHTFGDMRPYAYRSTDYGRTWTALVAADAPVRGYAHVVKEDLVNRNLLFLGTEFGLYVSLDGGGSWAHYKGGGLPDVAVRDLVVHPRDNDLVIATHGRGIWIVDDITPLRALTPATLASDVTFLQATPAVQRLPAGGGWSNGDAVFIGDNPTDDAVITYYQRRRHIFGDMKMEVRDSAGQLVGTVPVSERRGISRVTWGMRLKPPPVPPAASAAGGAFIGPRLLPGVYTVKMMRDTAVYTTRLRITADPRSRHTAADRRAQLALAKRLAALLADMTYGVEKINGARAALDARAASLSAGDTLAVRLRTASGVADSLRKKIVATKEGGMITGEQRLREDLADLYGSIVGYEGLPSATQVQRASTLARQLGEVMTSFDAWASRELESINAVLTARQLRPISLLTRAQWDASRADKH